MLTGKQVLTSYINPARRLLTGLKTSNCPVVDEVMKESRPNGIELVTFGSVVGRSTTVPWILHVTFHC